MKHLPLLSRNTAGLELIFSLSLQERKEFLFLSLCFFTVLVVTGIYSFEATAVTYLRHGGYQRPAFVWLSTKPFRF